MPVRAPGQNFALDLRTFERAAGNVNDSARLAGWQLADHERVGDLGAHFEGELETLAEPAFGRLPRT